MKLISWNVNGFRAVIGKGFTEIFEELDADVFCIQETKLQAGQVEIEFPGYEQYWNYAQKKGYSGTAVFTRIHPKSVSYGLGIAKHDTEGRVITLEFDAFFLVNVYTPNAQDKLARIDYRMQWDDDFHRYLKNLEKTKPVVVCGDLNVANEEIDLKNPKTNRGNAGFSDQEREKIKALLNDGFVDTFRFFNPDKTGAYSWWSYRFNARKNNAGWRIDYFLVSESLRSRLLNADILSYIYGSDHCPVELGLEI